MLSSSSLLSFIIIIVVVIFVITFIQGIYNYIPETNHVSRVYSVASGLYLQFVLHVTLFCPLKYYYISTFRSVCAVTNMVVFCSS